jgi:hypothetical protein
MRRSLGRLCSRTCSTSVEASIVKALSQAAPLRGLLNFSGRQDASYDINELLLEVALVMPTGRQPRRQAIHWVGQRGTDATVRWGRPADAGGAAR